MNRDCYDYITFVRGMLSEFVKLDDKVSMWIASLSALETGYGSSSVCRKNQNYFGMKHPRHRITTSLGMKNNHAEYLCMRNSVMDFLLWLEFNGFNQIHLNDFTKFVNKFSKTFYNPNMLSYIDTINAISISYFDLWNKNKD